MDLLLCELRHFSHRIEHDCARLKLSLAAIVDRGCGEVLAQVRTLEKTLTKSQHPYSHRPHYHRTSDCTLTNQEIDEVNDNRTLQPSRLVVIGKNCKRKREQKMLNEKRARIEASENGDGVVNKVSFKIKEKN